MYTCLIVDDEPLAQDLLAAYIEKIPYLRLAQKCSTAWEAQLTLQQHQVDILFMDIQMPGLTGIDFLRLQPNRPATILTTAYSEYALTAFDLEVVDYLLKPIEFDRFFKAITKTIKQFPKQHIETASTSFSPSALSVPPIKEAYCFVKSDSKMVKVNYAEILFIESMQKYIRIHTNKERIVALQSLSSILAHLPTAQFIRIHRSYIINMNKIDNIFGNTAVVGRHELPISKGQRESFFALIEQRRIA